MRQPATGEQRPEERARLIRGGHLVQEVLDEEHVLGGDRRFALERPQESSRRDHVTHDRALEAVLQRPVVQRVVAVDRRAPLQRQGRVGQQVRGTLGQQDPDVRGGVQAPVRTCR